MKAIKILLFLLIGWFGNIHAQYFAWAKRAGLYAFDLGYGVGADSNGNVYIAGKYEMNANFGGTTVGCAGNHDIYVAKYSPSGTFHWVRTAGGKWGDYAHAIAVDGAGNSYVTGEFEVTSYFGSLAMTSTGNNDVFLAKYDTNGNLLWAKKVGGGTNNDRGLGIAVSNGNIYITGRFIGTAYFSGTTLTSSGGVDIFVAKYNGSGILQWAKKAGGSGDDEGFAISTDAGGNSYVTGYFNQTANFSGTSLSSNGGTDIFIAKYNTSGALQWVKKAGAGGNDAGNAIKVDNAGRIFVTGGFRYKTTFGAFALQAPGGHSDIFVVRYDASGNVIWAKKAGGGDNDSGRAIAADANGNTFITGNCGQSATFGTTTVNGADVTELFFASWDVNGNFKWVLKAGGPADASDPDRFIEMGLSICTDPGGSVYASGAYRSSSVFGSTTLAPWSTHTEVFLTRINPPGRESSILAAITPSGQTSFCSRGNVLLKATEDSTYQYQWEINGKPIPGAVSASYKASVPGDYTVLIRRGGDSLRSETTVVRESQSLTTAITPSAPVFCKDSNVVLLAQEGSGYLYQWKRNGKAIPGATGMSYKPDQPGEYQVKIIQGSCFGWSPVLKVELQNCGGKDSAFVEPERAPEPIAKEDSVLVKIYPNPNNGLFTLEVNMPETGDPVIVELVNPLGQFVYRKLIPSGTQHINEHIELENSVPTGIYFLQITVGNLVEKTAMMLCR